MTLQEKYAQATAKKRPNPNMVWLTNEQMNARDPENPTLVEVPVRQFARPGNSWVKQGYTKFTPAKPAPAPVEAKPAPVKSNSEPVKN